MRNTIRTFVMLVTILLLPLLVLVAQETSALLIEGHQGHARVIQVQGKNYVEVEALARITGGSLRFAGNQIILTLPGGANVTPQTDQSAPAAALSRPFLSAGIETMREILEWHAALKTGVERGYSLSDVWFDDFRRQIQSSLKQTEAAASTDVDQRVLPLLINEFNTMDVLTDKYLKIAKSRDYLAPGRIERRFAGSEAIDVLAIASVDSVVESICGRRFLSIGKPPGSQTRGPKATTNLARV